MRSISVLLLLVLLAHTRADDTSDDAGINRKFITVNPRGGFGNRLGALVFGHVMARLHNRTLLVDWEVVGPAGMEGSEDSAEEMSLPYQDIFDHDQEDIYAQPSAAAYAPALNADVWWCRVWNSVGCALGVPCARAHFDGADFQDPACIDRILLTESGRGCGTVHFRRVVRDVTYPLVLAEYGAVRRAQIAEYHAEFFREKLRFHWKLERQAEHVAENLFPGGRFMVGVHVRTYGEATGDAWMRERMGRRALHEIIQDFVERMRKTRAAEATLGHVVTFFVASDDREAVRMLRDSFDDDETVALPLIRVSRDAYGQRTAILEFLLLAKTNYILGSAQSTFSDMAALLTTEGKKYEVGPRPYPGMMGSMATRLFPSPPS